VSPVKYELGSYIPEDGILHSDRRGNLKPHRKVECQHRRSQCSELACGQSSTIEQSGVCDCGIDTLAIDQTCPHCGFA
jgi:hypothetical protein